MKLKKGDKVIVVAGREKGKEGKIIKTFRDRNKVIVENVNLMKKHQKSSGQNPGSITEFEAPLDASNVMLIDPTTKTRTRVGYTIEKEKKVRISRKSKKAID